MRATISSGTTLAAMVVLPVGLVLAGLLVVVDPPYDLALVTAVAFLLAGLLLPLNVLLFIWAAILPIWSVGPLPTVTFDIARFALGVIIGVRAWVARHPANVALKRWIVPLGVVAVLVTVLGWWHQTGITEGLTMLVSVILVGWVLWRAPGVWPLLLGFATGVTISALVLVGTATGVGSLDVLVPNANPGFGRYTGLGTAATRVSIELALAAVIWWAGVEGKRVGRLVGAGAGGVVVVALLISGGRTGLACLVLAAVVALVRRWMRPAPSIVLLAAAGFAIFWMGRRGVSFSTLDRLMDADQQTGFDSGRIFRLSQAWERFADSPLLGDGTMHAHFAPLTFALAGGIVAAIIITVLSVRIALMCFVGPSGQKADALTQVGCLIAAALLVSVVLETTGPFLGTEMVTLLLLAVLATSGTGAPLKASSAEPLAHPGSASVSIPQADAE